MATTQSRIPDIYEDGTYLSRNPLWHVDESPWKVTQIVRMLRRNRIAPQTICDVGCGVGEVLRLLQQILPSDCHLLGYEASPQAYQLCHTRANERLQFKLADVRSDTGLSVDLMLLLDVIEHVEDYFNLLRGLKQKARLVILHIPLDLSVQTVLRKNGLLKRRDMYAHLHYFTKDVALRMLEELGYEVVDYFYTPRSNELGSEFVQTLLRPLRKICFALNQDLAVRLLGGYSLLVLAR